MTIELIGPALQEKTHNSRANHLLLILAAEADNRGMVEVSQGYLAARMEVSISTIAQALGHLKRSGYIEQVGAGNKWGSPLYRLKLVNATSDSSVNMLDIDMRDYRAKKKRMGRFAEVGLEQSMEGKGIWSDVE